MRIVCLMQRACWARRASVVVVPGASWRWWAVWPWRSSALALTPTPTRHYATSTFNRPGRGPGAERVRSPGRHQSGFLFHGLGESPDGGIRGDFTVIDGLRSCWTERAVFKQVSATTIAINTVDHHERYTDPPAEDRPPVRQPKFANQGGPQHEQQRISHTHGQPAGAQRRVPGRQPRLWPGRRQHDRPGNRGRDGAGMRAPLTRTTAGRGGGHGHRQRGWREKARRKFRDHDCQPGRNPRRQPSSAADLLKIVPRVWAESGGGEAGPNIELAGYPGGGGSPYVT